jgi:hypothetical protein
MRSLRLFGVCLALMFMLSACSSPAPYGWPPPDRTEPLSIPQYPNAKNEQSSTKPSVPGFDNQYLEFQTDDSVEQVMEFYQTHLEQHAWHSISAGYEDNPDSTVYGSYYVDGGNEQGCPLYSFYSLIKPVETGETKVTIKLLSNTCLLR